MKNLINLTASYKTDRYMGGVIKANQREKCSGCGSAFKNVKLPEFENTVPFCTPCKKYPRLFRIRITLPGSPKKDVRYNFEGRRLTKPSLADAALIRIRDEIRNGTFDSLKYISKKNKSGLLLKNFINFYIDTRENLTPAARKSMLSLDKNYLSPFFGETYLSDITSGLIKSFEIQWKPVGNAKTTRQRDKCLELLKSILKLAKELEYIKFIPNFPKIAKTKRKKHVIDFETQEKIINNIPTHLRAAFKLMQLYMIRPCEVRALRWKDINTSKAILHIRRHFSLGTELNGRKSISSDENDFFDHTISIQTEFFHIMQDIPRSINNEDYIFRTRTGRHLSESTLRKAWNKSIRELGLEHIDLYSGLKRSSGQLLVNNGVPIEQVRVLMGQSSVDSTKHYVSESATSLGGVVEDLQKELRLKLKSNRIEFNQ